jgi:hypothetical protein
VLSKVRGVLPSLNRQSRTRSRWLQSGSPKSVRELSEGSSSWGYGVLCSGWVQDLSISIWLSQSNKGFKLAVITAAFLIPVSTTIYALLNPLPGAFVASLWVSCE